MIRKQGFTLVELLVVIAIISILASVAVIRIPPMIEKAKRSAAISEIRQIDTGLTGMLADARMSNFRHFFKSQGWLREMDYLIETDHIYMVECIYHVYTPVFYDLLKNGKDAESDAVRDWIKKDVLRRLGSGYLDVGKDPWNDQLYRFFPGKWKSKYCRDTLGGGTRGINAFRTKWADESVPGSVSRDMWTKELSVDGEIVHGWPAPKNMSMYVFSFGSNRVGNQLFYLDYDYESFGTYYDQSPDYGMEYDMDDPDDAGFLGGGDDINNWDLGQSWHIDD